MVPDYYTMLGADPRSDTPTLEAALARCQPVWSSGTRNPKTKHTFQSYLDQIPAIRQTLMGEPSVRAAYDAELFAGRRAERDRKLDELQHRLRLRSAKGGLTLSDRTLLRAEAVRLGLTHDDLDRLAEPIPPMPEAPADEEDSPEVPVDVVDAATRRQIRTALEHLHRRDLYDALELTRDAPVAEIVVRADSERQRWMRKSQVTAEKTAWLEVVSYAQSHLSAPEARARYDRTLAQEAEEAFLEAVRFALSGLSRLDPGTRQILLSEGAARGLSPDRAGRLLQRECRSAGVSQEGGASATTAGVNGALRLLRCRSCSGVTDFARVARSQVEPLCVHCGASLQWDCPVCQRKRWVDETRCACGFPLELREPLIRHFEAAQQAHKTRDFATALAELTRVRELAPKHVGARKGIEKIKERLAEIEAAKTTYEVEFARRRLIAARGSVEAWARLVDPTTPELRAAWSTVARGLRDAEALAARARNFAATDPKAARELYQQSLAVAADQPEVIEALRRCPPDPPTDLRVDFEANRVRLRWTPPLADGLGPVEYRVRRKRQGVPASATDGEAVVDVGASSCEDSAVGSGESVGYAVFSRRSGVESIRGASAGPFLIVGEVLDVRVDVQRGEVHLNWKPPKGAVDVRVVRKQGSPPARIDDGERIEALRDQARDVGLSDDRVYHYGIFAVYRTPEGGARASRGVFVSAMPHTPARGVGELILGQEPDGGIRVRWEEPERGQVRIVRSPKPLGLTPGERLSTPQAEAIRGQWLEATAPDHAFDPKPPTSGVCHYTPLTAWAGSFTVGRGAAFSRVPDPSDLRAVRVGVAGRVHLRWRWSPQGSESLVVAKAGSAPTGPDDPRASVFSVQETEYSRQGYYALTLPASEDGPWHLAVFGVATVEGEGVISPGLDPTSRTVVPGPHPEVTVSYTLRRPKLPGRPWSVTFRTEPPGSSIPPTALVAHARTVPLSVDDGMIVDHFPAAADGATFRVRPGANLNDHRARIFADPQAALDGQAPIRLRHPETEGTRV